MYPDLEKDVELGTFQYEGSDETFYYAKNAQGKDFTLPYRVWRALMKADGTAPLDLPNEGKDLLPRLKRWGLVRTSRFVRDNGMVHRFILFLFPRKKGRLNRKLFRALDTFLSVITFLIFSAALFCMLFMGGEAEGELKFLLCLALLFVSVVFHEVGHGIACLAYGYEIREVGLLLLKVIPLGAYIAHEEKKNASRRARCRVYLSGIEMNFLLAGLFYFLSRQGGAYSVTLSWTAYINTILAVSNLFPVEGFDGEGALSALCGVDSIFKLARRKLLYKKSSAKLLHSGLSGFFAFLFLWTVLLAKVFFCLFTVFVAILVILSEI